MLIPTLFSVFHSKSESRNVRIMCNLVSAITFKALYLELFFTSTEKAIYTELVYSDLSLILCFYLIFIHHALLQFPCVCLGQRQWGGTYPGVWLPGEILCPATSSCWLFRGPGPRRSERSWAVAPSTGKTWLKHDSPQQRNAMATSSSPASVSTTTEQEGWNCLWEGVSQVAYHHIDQCAAQCLYFQLLRFYTFFSPHAVILHIQQGKSCEIHQVLCSKNIQTLPNALQYHKVFFWC